MSFEKSSQRAVVRSDLAQGESALVETQLPEELLGTYLCRAGTYPKGYGTSLRDFYRETLANENGRPFGG